MLPNSYKLFWLLVFMLLSSVPVCSQSEPLLTCLNNKCRDEKGEWELTLPAKWIQKPNEGGIWEFAAPDEWLTVRVWNSSYEAGTTVTERIMAQELRKFVTEPAWGIIGDAGLLNGMPVVENSGTGKVGEKEVAFDLTALQTRTRLVFLLTITTQDGFKNNLNDFSDFFNSIKSSKRQED
jgi:hypothetical protein